MKLPCLNVFLPILTNVGPNWTAVPFYDVIR